MPQPQRLIRAVEFGADWTRRIAKPVQFFPNQEVEDILARPTWSVRSLLPEYASQTKIAQPTAETNTAQPTSKNEEVTREKLHHLLRLSALPLPKSPAEESKLLSTLRSQIHFVRAVQSVDTTNIKPLVAIRDETSEAIEEQTIHVKDLQPWFDLEEKVGRNGTVRRRKVERESVEGKVRTDGEGGWDPFELGVGSEEGSGRRMGRWFVVKKAKKVETTPVKKSGKVEKTEVG